MYIPYSILSLSLTTQVSLERALNERVNLSYTQLSPGYGQHRVGGTAYLLIRFLFFYYFLICFLFIEISTFFLFVLLPYYSFTVASFHPLVSHSPRAHTHNIYI